MEEVKKDGRGGYRGKGDGFGRPPKKEQDRQDKQIRVNVSVYQKELIEHKAKEAGLSISAYLVKKGLEG
jgi:hypothetical protein